MASFSGTREAETSKQEETPTPFPKHVDREGCVLEGGRFVLRPYVPGQDEALLLEAVQASLPELGLFLPWATPDYSLRSARDFIRNVPKLWEEGRAYHFGVFAKKGGACLGGVGLDLVSQGFRILNLGYWSRSSETGKGLATEGGRLVSEFAIRELGAYRVEVLAVVGNGASRRVAEKIGAQFEGILRNRLTIHGQTQDAAMFSLIPHQ